MHLSQGPNIWIWSSSNKVHIRWNNESLNVDGIQPWTTDKGEFILSADDFMHEVLDFHQRLMKQMSQRIEEILSDNPIPNVKIDMNALRKEHEERKMSLDKAITKKPTVLNFEPVIHAINRLLGPNKANTADAPKARAAD